LPRTIYSGSSSMIANHSFVLRALVGFTAGVLTVVANVAGSVVAVYLMRLQLPKRQMNGTRAWLFFLSNALCKIPGQLAMGNLELADVATVAPLCAIAALSTYATELYIFPLLNQALFEKLSYGLLLLGRSSSSYQSRLRPLLTINKMTQHYMYV
jgi:hypothetical protein